MDPSATTLPSFDLMLEAYVPSFIKIPWMQVPDVELVTNPRPKDIVRIDEGNFGFIRGYLVGDDLVIWSEALHKNVRRAAGLPEDALPLNIGHERGIIHTAQVTDASNATPWHHNPDVADYIREHPYMSSNVEISYYDEAIVGDWEDLEPESEETFEGMLEDTLCEAPTAAQWKSTLKAIGGESDIELKLQVAEMDPTGTRYKYGTWLLKQIKKFEIDPSLNSQRVPVQDMLGRFHNLKAQRKLKGADADINKYDAESLKAKIAEFGEREFVSKSSIRKGKADIASIGNIVAETDKWLVVESSDAGDVADLAHGGAWCLKDPEWAQKYIEKGPVYIVFTADPDVELARESRWADWYLASAFTFNSAYEDEGGQFYGFEWRDADNDAVNRSWLKKNDPDGELYDTIENLDPGEDEFSSGDRVDSWLSGSRGGRSGRDPYEDPDYADELIAEAWLGYSDDFADALEDAFEANYGNQPDYAEWAGDLKYILDKSDEKYPRGRGYGIDVPLWTLMLHLTQSGRTGIEFEQVDQDDWSAYFSLEAKQAAELVTANDVRYTVDPRREQWDKEYQRQQMQLFPTGQPSGYQRFDVRDPVYVIDPTTGAWVNGTIQAMDWERDEATVQLVDGDIIRVSTDQLQKASETGELVSYEALLQHEMIRLLEAPTQDQINSVAKKLDLDPTKVAAAVKKFDPDPRQRHGVWMLKMLGKHKHEPSEQLQYLLKRFMTAKATGALKGKDADVMSYNYPHNLKQKLDELPAEAFISKRAMKKGKGDPLAVPGSTLAGQSENWKVYRVDSPEAAMFHGKGTNWCTRASDSAKSYTDAGPLYVGYQQRKKGWGQAFQTDQSMDAFQDTESEDIDAAWFIDNDPDGELLGVLEQIDQTDEDTYFGPVLDQIKEQREVIAEFKDDLDEWHDATVIAMPELDASGGRDLLIYATVTAMLQKYGESDGVYDASMRRGAAPQVVVNTRDATPEVLDVLRKIRAKQWEPAWEAQSEIAQQMESNAIDHFVPEFESRVKALPEEWYYEGRITDEQYEAMQTEFDRPYSGLYELFMEMQEQANTYFEYDLESGAWIDLDPLVDAVTPSRLADHLGLSAMFQQPQALQPFFQQAWQQKARGERGEESLPSFESMLSEATDFKSVWHILQSDNLEARRPWIEALWPEYVNTDQPDWDNDYHVGVWGEYHQPEKYGRARLPLVDLSQRLKKLGVSESRLTERAIDVLPPEERQEALDWVQATLKRFAREYSKYGDPDEDEMPVRLSYNSINDNVFIEATREEPLRPVKLALILYVEYDPKISEHAKPAEMTTNTLIVGGEMRFPSLSSQLYSRVDAIIWLEIVTADHPTRLDFNEVRPYIEYTIDHEASHAARMVALSTTQINQMLRGPKAVQAHPRLAGEWEANLSAIVSYYRRLSPEEQETITLSQLLQNAGFPREARLVGAYGAESEKWRHKLMTALSKEGIVVRHWESLPSFGQMLDETEAYWTLQPNSEDLAANLEALYELEYKYNRIKAAPFTGLAQRRKNILARMEQQAGAVAQMIAAQLLDPFEEWLEHHAITEPKKWAKVQTDVAMETGEDPLSMLQDWYIRVLYPNKRWQPGEQNRVFERAMEDISLADFDDSLGPVVEQLWDEEQVAWANEPEHEGEPYPYDLIENFWQEWVLENYGFIGFFNDYVPEHIQETVIQDLYEHVVFPVWYDYWSARGIDETRKRIEDATEELKSIAGGQALTMSDMFLKLNTIIQTAHQTGSMVDYIEGHYDDVDADFLQALSDRDNTDWDEELQAMGVGEPALPTSPQDLAKQAYLGLESQQNGSGPCVYTDRTPIDQAADLCFKHGLPFNGAVDALVQAPVVEQKES